MERVRLISWGRAVVGGLLGLGLTLLFSLGVAEPMADGLLRLGETITVGVLILVLALLRMVAGMWTAQLVRRKYEVDHRREYLPTALVAAVIGWGIYTALVLTLSVALGTPEDPLWLFLDVLQWLAEFGLGALLISPQRAEADLVVGRGRRR